MKFSIFVLSLISLCVSSNAKLLDLIELEVTPDLNAPLCDLSDVNLAINDKTNNYVLVDSSTVADSEFVRKSSQLLASISFKLCTVPSNSLESDIVVLRSGGFKTFFYGKRDAYTLVRYVQQLGQQVGDIPYRTIHNKMDKKAFEHLVVPKVLAYFPDITAPAFAEFQLVAGQLSPNPPFYVVHDPLIAARFRLTQPAQVALIRRLEKSTLLFTPSIPTTPESSPVFSAQEIVTWINSNKGLVLHELDDTNLYDPELSDLTKYQLVAIGDKTTSLGYYVYKTIKKTIQNITRENESILNPVAEKDDSSLVSQDSTPKDLSQIVKLDDIELVWVDLQKYPMAGSKLLLQNISPVKDVWFGLVQIPSTELQSPQWFDFGTLNTTGTDKHAEEMNIQLLKDWILTVTNRNINLSIDSSSLPQTFIMEPESILVRQGGNFMLDCKVANKLGECSWTKDGLPISIGLPPYNWAQSEDTTDCSITVTNADPQRDVGIWRCHVSGIGQTAAITSNPVSVTFRTSPKKEL